jgi:alanine-glyoxylate transaminase/serine-glyoxylate transaminase/serine-pyruvate transaminase
MQKYEARQPSYFATPPVQLIMALEVSLKQFMEQGMESRFAAHLKASQKFKDACKRLGLRLVPVNEKVAANTLSALYYPDGVAGPELLKSITAGGVVVAGGLHPQHNTKYFRVGHMNVSAVNLDNGHVDKVIAVLENSLKV